MKKIIIIICSLLTVFIVYFLFFKPNIIIVNKKKINVGLDGKNLGNSDRIIKHLSFGNHFIADLDTKGSIQVLSASIMAKEVEALGAPPIKEKVYPNEELAVAFSGPKLIDDKIYFLGGRHSSILLAYDPAKNSIQEVSKDNLMGTIDVAWNESAERAIITIDRTLYTDPQFSNSETSLWLFDSKTKLVSPLEFDVATFLNKDRVVGIKDSTVLVWDNGEYTAQTLYKPTRGSNILAEDNILLFWKDSKAQLYINDKLKKINVDGAITGAALSKKYICFTTNQDGAKKLLSYNIETREKILWPYAFNDISKASDNSFVSTLEKEGWIIDLENERAMRIFAEKDFEIYKIFGENKKIFSLTGGILYGVNF